MVIEYIDTYLYNRCMDKIFKALADKNRRKILTLLKDREMSVNELLINFDIRQATLSNHLSILKKSELVYCRVVGQQRIYRINYDLLAAFAENMRKFVGKLDKSFVDDIAIRPRMV
jgi:ArsR family transcriptional regulator, arsenate/arsenite/antimonite-responsive transcriptional repressor